MHVTVIRLSASAYAEVPVGMASFILSLGALWCGFLPSLLARDRGIGRGGGVFLPGLFFRVRGAGRGAGIVCLPFVVCVLTLCWVTGFGQGGPWIHGGPPLEVTLL